MESEETSSKNSIELSIIHSMVRDVISELLLADTQISGLNIKPTPVTATDQLAIDDDSDVTWKITALMLLAYINSNAQITQSQVTNLTSDLSDLQNQIDSAAQRLGDMYTPVINILSGANTVTLNSAIWTANSNSPGGIYTASVNFSLFVDGSGNIINVEIPGPIIENFTDPSQAVLLGFSVINESNIGVPGAIGSGWLHELYANTGGSGVLLRFETAQISQYYAITVSWIGKLQDAPLITEDK